MAEYVELAFDRILFHLLRNDFSLTNPNVGEPYSTWLYDSDEPMLRAIPIKGDDIWEMVARDNEHYLPLLQNPPLAVSPFTYTAIDVRTEKPGTRLLVHISMSRDLKEMDRFYDHYFKRTRNVMPVDIDPTIPSQTQAKYMYMIQFFQVNRLNILNITPSHVCFLDEKGELLKYPGNKGGAWITLVHEYNKDDNYEKRKKWMRQLIHFSLFLFSLMNCKNVIILKNDAPLEMQKKRMKKFGMPFVTYRTIRIKPILVKSNSKECSHTETIKRLHICRGNFARYTEDKPLFGKYAGLFFRPQHFRGKLSAGLATKDYKIENGFDGV
jgi:hypothetical protein